MFSCDICKIFKSTYLEEHLRTTASGLAMLKTLENYQLLVKSLLTFGILLAKLIASLPKPKWIQIILPMLITLDTKFHFVSLLLGVFAIINSFNLIRNESITFL